MAGPRIALGIEHYECSVILFHYPAMTPRTDILGQHGRVHAIHSDYTPTEQAPPAAYCAVTVFSAALTEIPVVVTPPPHVMSGLVVVV